MKLREKKVESVFCRNLQNLDEKNKTDSLYDWVPTEEVHGMQKEAFSEMSAMQKLSGYLKIVGCKLEKKYEFIYKMTKLFEVAHSECSISLAKNKIELQKRELDTINSIYFGIASHYDRLFYLRKSDKIIDLSGLSGTTDSLSDNLSQILDCLKRIEEVSIQVDEHNARFEKAFTLAYRINELLDYFGIECTKKSKGFVSLEKIYSDHFNGYKHLFEQLESLSTFYGQFIVSYNEMLFEIYRRRKQLEKQQEMVENFQKELDIFYDREVDLREQFQRNYGDFLPPNICPAIYEEQFVRRIIYPEFYETSLPEIEGAFTRTSKSLVDLALSTSHYESNDDVVIDLNTSEEFLNPLT